jgi:hypothetical protein
MLGMVEALCWYKPEDESFESLKQKGNDLFLRKDFEGMDFNFHNSNVSKS